jgi:hypothetical protein
MSLSRVDKEGPRSTLKHWIIPPQVKGAWDNSITMADETHDSPKKPKGKKGGKTPEPSPNRPTTVKPRSLTEGAEARMIPHGKQDKVGKKGMDVEDGTEGMELKEVEGSEKEAGGKPPSAGRPTIFGLRHLP